MFQGAAQWLAQMAFGENIVKSLADTLTFNIGNVFDQIDKIQALVQPIASVLLCIYLVIEIMDKVTEGTFTTEQFLKILIKLAFGIFIISNATAFVLQFANVGVSLMGQIAEIASLGGFSTTVKMEDLSLKESFTYIFMLLIPAAVGFIMQIAVRIMGYARSLEIIVRAMFAPIGVADVIHGGANSHGIKYLKECLALAIQGAIMMGIAIAGGALMQSLVADGLSWSYILAYLGLTGGIVGLLGQSKSIAREVIG